MYCLANKIMTYEQIWNKRLVWLFLQDKIRYVTSMSYIVAFGSPWQDLELLQVKLSQQKTLSTLGINEFVILNKPCFK